MSSQATRNDSPVRNNSQRGENVVSPPPARPNTEENVGAKRPLTREQVRDVVEAYRGSYGETFEVVFATLEEDARFVKARLVEATYATLVFRPVPIGGVQPPDIVVGHHAFDLFNVSPITA
eukprot:PhM_4_TR18024/c1_g3_i5/m.93144